MDNNRRILESMDEFKESKEFWLNKLSGELNEVILTADFFKTGDYAAGIYERDLTKELTDGLNRISKNNGLALYVVLLSALKVLLNKYTGQEDIAIASPAYIQSDIDSSYIENQLILFRSKLSDDMTFRELLRSEKVNVMETYKNQYYSLEKVFNELKLNYKEYSSNCIVLTLDSIHNKECISNSRQIVFSVLSGEPCCKIHISYNANLFNNKTIERLANNYLNILIQGIGETDKKITDIEAMTEEEKNLLLKFNDTDADYPRDKTIHVLFEEQAAKTPNNTAVVFEGKGLTYEQLNEKANRLARNLRENGVKPNSLIGIMVERSFEMVIGIIGILKAGGAYLPIAPDYPEERIRYILEDSGTKILLTQDRFIDKLSFNGTVLSLEDEKTYDLNGDNLENISTPRDLAYVIYTSGSTGKPKGAMIENYSLVNRLNWMQKQYPLKGEDVILQKTTYTFDVSVWELIWWSLVGAKVCMLEQGKEKDPKAIADIIEKEKITTIHFVPSMLSIFMEYIIGEKQYHKIKTLRRVFASGEAIGAQQVKSFVENISSINETQLINLYGPTEATVDVTYYNCAEAEGNKSIPIGKPIDNIRLYIVDKQNKLQPIGVPGELCISGDGLARGYLNRVELTQEKFVICPFDKDERMYKTGDLARWLPDGNVEFLGRLDHQVKIRGFRIELGEIESLILSFHGVKEAIVIDKQDKDENKYLCAYMVSEGELSAVELRTYLSSKLPYYMVPSYFVQLHKMPLTSNGKLDRKKLPEPSGNAIITTDYEAPRDVIEEKLANIWREVLGIEKVGINDNFIELGGHSLKATIISSKIHKELNVEIPLGEIFNSPTIKEISNYINRVEKNMYKSIEKAEKKEYYEASLVQNRMYMLQQFDQKSVGYNMPVCLEIHGDLDVAKLEKVMKELIKRHESFRTAFNILDDKIVQVINDVVDFNIEYLEKEDINIEQFIRSYIRPFDLSVAPLVRMCVIKVEKNKYILLYDMHHIISDGVSLAIMGDEILKLYRGEVLEEPELQYKDYSEWQKKLIRSGELKKQEKYWLDQFSGEIPILNMPTDYERPALMSFHGEDLGVKLDKELVKQLKTLAKNTESTMYIVLISALNILLSKYSGQEDIIIGSPISGRTHVDFEKVIGMFINTIALRNFPIKDKTYEEFLKEVKANSFKAFENQDYEFKELLDKLSIPIDVSRNPLFDVLFVMQNIESDEGAFNELKINKYPVEHNVAKLDLTFTAKEFDEDMILVIQYCTELFKRETVERMLQHLINILKQITTDRHLKLNEIEMLSMEERNKLLYEFNNTKLDYPRNNPVHKLFEEQARKTPENIALVFNGEILTYKELDIKSNKLAKNLREKGVKQDSIVALIVESSLEMIIGMIAVLKAGGAYLPISSEYPEDRIKYILEDSKANIILAQNKFADLISFDREVLNLSDSSIYVGAGEELTNINSLEDLAYVIYTSGTTGKPKGVMIEHKNLLNYVNAFQYEYKLTEADNVLQQANYSFDAFIEEIYPALTVGGKIFIVNKYDALNISYIQEFIYENKINLISCSPLFLNELNKLDKLESVHTFISGGDVLKKEYFNNLIKHSKVYNTCGPTETTVCFSYYNCPKEISGNIPIGGPIANYQIYILDSSRRLVPVGVVGEIYVSGDGLARGYINSSELTAQRFIDNPFRAGEKMYKTGDLGRWLPDGNIEFLGRVDHQIKIRGFRIEIGEIEDQLFSCEGIKEAFVLDREDKNGGKYLCAYIAVDKELTVAEIREGLAKNLPEYMIPAYFIQLEKIPQTSNGKVDRKALLKLDVNVVTGVEYEAPRNELEGKIADIWSEVLGIEKIGINDNFFELGGHSLKATTLVGKLHKEFNVKMPLSEVFISPTIKGISNYLEKTEKNMYNSIKPIEKKERYEASSAQKRLYMLQQFDLQSTGYNMPKAIQIKGKFNNKDIEKILRILIERHETLRTSFEAAEQKIVQKISEDVDFKLQYIEKTDKDIDEIIKEFIRPFDLSKAPLLRAGVIRLEEENHILMFDMHHIISDGISMGILVDEFIKLCSGIKLEELKIQYKDYSEWQNNILKSEELKKQEEYWVNRFSDEVPVLNVQTDYARPLIHSLEGESISFKLDKDITKELKKIARETGSTMYMLILSGINILLSKYSGQEDIIIGSTIAGRPHADLEKIVGMFVNTLALRNYPIGNKTYKEFLLEVKENALRAYENQDYQFEELVDKINIRRDLGRNPLFDVMFTMLNTLQSKMQNNDNSQTKNHEFSITTYRQENKVSKFDMTFGANELDDEVLMSLEYCTKLFKRETIERMIAHFIEIFKTVTSDVNIKISEIGLLTEKEKHKLLYEFNDTYADYARCKTIHQVFEEQVEKTPNNIAVVFEDKKLTYKELNEKANRLAKTLRERGVKPDDIVAIMAERSLDMIVGIMAILKAGGAYLPIDPEYPEDRIKYIFEDSKADIILTQNKFMEKVLLDGQKIRLEDESAYADEGDNLEIINTSKDLAYVIYTSGSTGLPKGVMIEHHSVINRINWMQKSYPISEADIIMQKTTYTFDVSVWELFWWSFAGASVCLLPPKGERDPEVILNCIEKNKITTMHFVPSMFNGFMLYVYVKEEKNRLSGLRQIFCSGEALTKKQVEMFGSLTENIRLINLYGPTEATVDVSYYECLKEESSNSIPIGKPIDNISLYIIGSNNQLQPIGVAGELCISGVGLARGYLNKAELTKEKFIENPFIKGERMYKTGDLARWLTDGNIEYLGRIDHQVKIRGFRIELGEIEAVLKKHPAVKETVVVARNIKGDLNVSRLIAYLTLEGEEKPSDELLQGFLRSKLPDYMVPSYFITLENIPLTSNGKVNTKALPEPNNELLNIEEHYVAPSTSIEKTLAEIWTKVLNVNKIGIHDNFFNLGGDSILSILVVSQAKEKGLSLSVQQVFLHPTIAELAKELDLSKPEPAPKEKAQAFSLLSEKDRAKLFKLNNQDDPLHKRSE